MTQFVATPKLIAALARPARVVRRVAPYVAIARPDHWFKNVFMALGVLLAYFYHPGLSPAPAATSILWAFAATCLLASSNYVLNEILDAGGDRSHPVKRNRPVASSQILTPLAYAQWVLLGAAGLAMASAVNGPFLVSALALLGMGVVYNVPPVRSKELQYIDVLSESVNNPIRLLLGWFTVTSASLPPVSLLISYWMIGAFFMSSKRLAEYRAIGDPQAAGAYRRSFRHYTEESLLVSMMFYTTVFALFLGIFIVRYRLELILLVPLLAGFVSYYLHITFKRDSFAQRPERLYRERGLMAYLVVLLLLFLGLMLVHIPVLYAWFNVEGPSGAAPLWKF